MKKTICYLLVIFFVLFSVLSVKVVKADTLDTASIEISKEKIAPGEEVTLTINFGKELGAYTVDAAYSSEIFDYVRSEGGTANDDKTKVRLVFYDAEGGSNPRTTASITFKAKEGLLTSNPTDFSVTLSGMTSPDTHTNYDDILTPMKKDILVEPNYVPYTLSLQYSGSILPNEQKVMTLVTSSSLGKNYDHARLTAEITKKPSNDATVQLFAIDSSEDVIDLLESGWGDAQGYKLGGENVNQKLNLSSLFSKEGDYTIHVKVVDRDASDAVIVENNFNVKVSKVNNAPQTTTSPSPEGSSSPSPSTEPSKEPENSPKPSTNNEEVPSTLPKTGGMQYLFIILVFSILIGAYLYISRKNKNN